MTRFDFRPGRVRHRRRRRHRPRHRAGLRPRGRRVVVADVDADALRAATDELTAAGGQALGVTCDVADEDQVAALVERTVAEFGRLDIAFNNAGI